MGALEPLKSVLGFPSVYDFYQSLVGEPGAHRRFIKEFVQPQPTDRVVDFGCGLGVILDYLPEGTPYLGIDLSESYVSIARQRYGNRAEFISADVHTADLSSYGPFDVGMAYGVMHHLDDETVLAMARQAKRVIGPGGRLLTVDPVYVDGQSRMAKFIISNDRGRFVRTEEGYRRLLESVGTVDAAVVTGFLRVPFTTLICTVSL